MSSHFNFKSLAFYGLAIGFVLVLFNVVTAYGETKVKAPAAIDGRYRLSYTQRPNCKQSGNLVLAIQQSGIYLNASLLPAQNGNKKAEPDKEKTSLSGLLSNQQLSLAGTVPTSICSSPAQVETNTSLQENAPNLVKIQSRVEGKNLEGQITLSGISEPITFTAQLEDPVEPSESSGH